MKITLSTQVMNKLAPGGKIMKWIYTKDFPREVKRYCEEHQLSYSQFARNIGVGRCSIYDWIKGRSFPRAELYEKVVFLLLEENENERNKEE